MTDYLNNERLELFRTYTDERLHNILNQSNFYDKFDQQIAQRILSERSGEVFTEVDSRVDQVINLNTVDQNKINQLALAELRRGINPKTILDSFLNKGVEESEALSIIYNNSLKLDFSNEYDSKNTKYWSWASFFIVISLLSVLFSLK